MFVFVTLSDLCDNIKYAWQEQRHKKFDRTADFWQYCQELYLEPKLKSMVELFCKNCERLLAINSFRKKAPPFDCVPKTPVACKEKIYLIWKSYAVVVKACFFIYLGDKKVVTGRVRQVIVLYSNNCMGIYNCMDSALVVL